jgi:hypothetical protein
LNVTTAAAWLSFFFALKHLEPAVVATLYNGAGPLAVLVVGALGWARAESRPSVGEWLCYAGLAVVLTALVIVVLADRSGLGATDGRTQGQALLAATMGGVMIAISHIIARWFNDCGVGSDAVMGTRFLLAFAVAVAIESAAAMTTVPPSPGALSLLVLAALALVVVPSFMLQLGIARSSPLAVNIMRALGPVSVFAVQQFDGRLRFSGATLLCIIGYGVFAVAASVLRAWSEVSMRPDDRPPRLEQLSSRPSSGRL